MHRARAAAVEIVQLVPIISFAFPFVVAGQVDLSAAGGAFGVGAGLAALVIGGLAWRKVPQNPILVGCGIWLAIGALAYAAVPPLEALIAEVQAASLFAVILATGAGYTAAAEGGYLGPGLSPEAARKGSIALLVLSAIALGWSLYARDIRLGGGLPFILLNISRRVMLRRLG